MSSIEKKEKAIELYIRYDLSATTVIRELGYPDRKTLQQWYQDSLENNGEHAPVAILANNRETQSTTI